MTCRMAAAAELFRDLARLHGEAEAVQDAALADAGIAREGDGLAAHGLVQGGNTLAAGRTRRKDREPGMAVDVRERLPALEVRLVDAQHDRHILVSRNGRDAVDQVKKLKKNSEITEDDQKKAEEDIQKLTDAAIKDIDKIDAEKEKEIMEVK